MPKFVVIGIDANTCLVPLDEFSHTVGPSCAGRVNWRSISFGHFLAQWDFVALNTWADPTAPCATFRQRRLGHSHEDQRDFILIKGPHRVLSQPDPLWSTVLSSDHAQLSVHIALGVPLCARSHRQLRKPIAWKVTEPTDYTLISNVCLLYTSPSPRDRQKSRMPSSA